MNLPALSPVYLLDTNLLILYARNGPLRARTETLYNLLTANPAPYLSIVSVAEAYSFARYRNWGTARVATLTALISAFRVLPIDSAPLVNAYVRMDDFSIRMGYTMGKNDLWIAATANVTGATLLTTDRDFDHLHGGYLLRDWLSPN